MTRQDLELDMEKRKKVLGRRLESRLEQNKAKYLKDPFLCLKSRLSEIVSSDQAGDLAGTRRSF